MEPTKISLQGIIDLIQDAITDEKKLDESFHRGRVQALEWVYTMLIESGEGEK